jgi:hypothetical protein
VDSVIPVGFHTSYLNTPINVLGRYQIISRSQGLDSQD